MTVIQDTYGIVTPRSTHMRPAKCEEMFSSCTSIVGQREDGTPAFCGERHCGPHAHGWKTHVDVGTDLGQRQARYIINSSGRHWTSKQNGNAVTFTFPAGQQCFAEHFLPIGRPPIFTVQFGQLARPSIVPGEEWVDRLGNNTIKIGEILKKG